MSLCLLLLSLLPRSTLFPYTTLFRSLVVGQVAVGLILLMGSGLLIRGWQRAQSIDTGLQTKNVVDGLCPLPPADQQSRSEEHTSELQSRGHLVCRLLLEKKKYNKTNK